MTESIIVPLVNPNEPEARIVKLFVQNGQAIEIGDLLYTLETTKSTIEVAAEEDGYITGIRFAKGEMVMAGDIFAFLADDPNWTPDEPALSSPDDREASLVPAGLRISQPALNLAQAHHLNLGGFPDDIFITKDMVQAVLDQDQIADSDPALQGFDPTSILIYGAGGHGKSILDLIQVLGTYSVLGFIDDGVEKGETVMGITVIGGKEILSDYYNKGVRLAVNAVGGIGNLRIRAVVFNRLVRAGFGCPTLVHPCAFVEKSAELSAGSQILPLAYVGSEVKIGYGTIVNNAAVVSHECILEDLVNIAPNAALAGGVCVGKGTLIGMGATINLGVSIGEGSRIGNGSTVKEDVPAGEIVPAGSIWPS